MSLSSQAAPESLDTVSPSSCRAEFERVLGSRTFSKPGRRRVLREYIGICSIAGRFDELSEQKIGISVFQRPPDYNCTEDTIVRVTARHLPEHLDLSYREEGLAGPLKITIPKGSSAATFQLVAVHGSAAVPFARTPFSEASALSGSSATQAKPQGRILWPRTARITVLVSALLAVALPLLVYLYFRSQPQSKAQQELQPFGPRGLKAYTLVARTDNLQGEGRVLLMKGTSMGTTYGALNFFTNEQLWQPVIRAAADKNGKPRNFQVLLISDFVRSGASNTQIAALHLH